MTITKLIKQCFYKQVDPKTYKVEWLECDLLGIVNDHECMVRTKDDGIERIIPLNSFHLKIETVEGEKE